MTLEASGSVRSRVRIEGIVQGVGFRPFVHRLAGELHLAGTVANEQRGVVIEVEGPADVVRRFTSRVGGEAPALAVIERLVAEPVPVRHENDFRIVASRSDGSRDTLVSPDAATCDACVAEILDPAQRRHRYAFTNCTDCGPRFTIVTDVPYDRASTTMAGFAMCEECRREYDDPSDRRFHAQPVCCACCGPTLTLVNGPGRSVGGDPLAATAQLLRRGSVVAVKGLGGFHLAADALDEVAVAALRSRKHREDKPFAVMVADLDEASALVEVDELAASLLGGPSRPIVLLPRRTSTRPLASAVAPGNQFLGVMLPYTPLHHLLVREVEGPLVLTSGNVSDEPIAYVDDEARDRLRDIADAFLMHDRPIHTRTDDSVVRVARGRVMPVRRSRGFAPQPVGVQWPFPRHVLACGAELKNTFALAKGRHVFLSHHIGDLENAETLRSFTNGIAHFRRLFDVAPAVVAHDLHPEYLSTKHAVELESTTGIELVGVQHHHAHVASCLADNDEAGPVIGVALDGLGLGTDGTLWGGELMVADLTGFTRVGHLVPVPMPGGAAAVRAPWRMAAAYLQAAYDDRVPADLPVSRQPAGQWHAVLAMARRGVNSPLTSSAGRLFDAVAALVGVGDRVNYEGQAAVRLEQLVSSHERASYPMRVVPGNVLELRGDDLVRAVVDDLRAGVDRSVIAARFHHGLAAALVRAVQLVGETTGHRTVALSGGVFQNVVLLDEVAGLLGARDFRVLVHTRVPTNDGGISLGQAMVAGARDRAV